MSRFLILFLVLGFCLRSERVWGQDRFTPNPILPNPVPNPVPNPLGNFPPVIPIPGAGPLLPGNSSGVCSPFASAAALQRCLKQFQDTSLPPQLLESLPSPGDISTSPPTPTTAVNPPTPVQQTSPPPSGLGAPEKCPAGGRLQLLPGGYVCLKGS
jgi:hypothetical protein